MIATFTRFDLGNLLTAPRRILSPFLFVIVIGVLSPTPLLAIPAAAAVTSLGVGTPFLNDERGRLDVLYATLPISRATVVVGRYIEMLVWFVAAALVGTVTIVATSVVRGHGVDVGSYLLVLALSFAATALALAVQLPIFFATGFTKARSAMFIPVIVIAIVCSAAAEFGLLTSELFIRAESSALTPAIAVLLGAVALVVSGFVATRIYRGRQF